MFFKIGFFVLLFVVIALVVLFMKMNPMKIEGAGSWIDYYSSDPEATIDFLNKNFGIQLVSTTPMAEHDGMEYSILKADGQLFPFAGIMGLPKLADGTETPPSTLVYLTVKDYDTTHKKLIESGAVSTIDNYVAGGIKFGIYLIPGGVYIGLAQYGVK